MDTNQAQGNESRQSGRNRISPTEAARRSSLSSLAAAIGAATEASYISGTLDRSNNSRENTQVDTSTIPDLRNDIERLAHQLAVPKALHTSALNHVENSPELTSEESLFSSRAFTDARQSHALNFQRNGYILQAYEESKSRQARLLEELDRQITELSPPEPLSPNDLRSDIVSLTRQIGAMTSPTPRPAILQRGQGPDHGQGPEGGGDRGLDPGQEQESGGGRGAEPGSVREVDHQDDLTGVQEGGADRQTNLGTGRGAIQEAELDTGEADRDQEGELAESPESHHERGHTKGPEADPKEDRPVQKQEDWTQAQQQGYRKPKMPQPQPQPQPRPRQQT
ncbi:hypothetical protein BG004_002277 [Podila humilis]|nr:hypothetical protein BG004_002277 [Podila humilis]